MDDYDKIKDICWCECIRHKMCCIVGKNIDTKKLTTMHSYLGFKYYDHADRNELNNRKYNLRPATATENSQNKTLRSDNTSNFIGVSYISKTGKWRARIYINKKETFLGSFYNKRDAIVARLNAEAKYYGEFAPQRHLFNEYGIVFSKDNTKLMEE